jgi:hypothetical protein
MSKYLISTTEVFRVDTDEEAKNLIEQAKNSSMFELGKYSSEFKEIKKTEETFYKVTLTKIFNDIKDPYRTTMPDYTDDNNI